MLVPASAPPSRYPLVADESVLPADTAFAPVN